MNPRILIVEDDNLSARLFREKIKEAFELAEIHICNSGKGAVEWAKQPDFPHIYVMDVGLEGEINGLQAADQIRTIRPESKFIYISGHEALIELTKAEIIRLLKKNDDSIFHEKPFDPDILVEEVDFFLSKLQLLGSLFILKDSIFIYKAGRSKTYIEKDKENGKKDKKDSIPPEHIRIRVEDISVFEANGERTYMYTIDGERYDIGVRIGTIVNQWRKHVLDGNLPDSFQRVHRSYVVNLMNLERYGTGCGIKMKGHKGGFIPLSNRENFERMLIRIQSAESKEKNNDESKDK